MYYIIYKEYEEWNQFEGSWITGFSKFDTYKLAETFRNGLLSNPNYYTKVSPILTEARCEKVVEKV